MAQQTSSTPKPLALAVFLGMIGVIIFGATLPVTKLAVIEFDPWFLTFARALMATIAAAILLKIMGRKLPKHRIGALFISGALLIFGFPGFMAIAMTSVHSSHGGVVLGILPLLTAVFAVVLAGERPSLLFWICAIAGSLLVIAFALRQGEGEFSAGDLWLLAAALSASSGYVIAGKLSRELPGWEVICWSLILLAPLSAAGSVFLWQSSYYHAEPASLWALAYLGMFSMFLGFFAWNEGLRLGGLARIGQLQLFQTFVTLGVAAVLLGEDISTETIIFAIAVVAIVGLGVRARVT